MMNTKEISIFVLEAGTEKMEVVKNAPESEV